MQAKWCRLLGIGFEREGAEFNAHAREGHPLLQLSIYPPQDISVTTPVHPAAILEL